MNKFVVIFILCVFNSGVMPSFAHAINWESCEDKLVGPSTVDHLGTAASSHRSLAVRLNMQTPEEYFTRDMWAAATALAKQLKAPMPPDFEAALLPLADTRRAIAARNGNENFERFGRKRTSDEYKTGHSIIYDESLDLGRRFAVEAREWPLRFSMRIGGQDIRLTYIAQKRGEDGFDWFHLKTRDVPPLMDRARRLYNMTLDKTLTRSQVIALVAELHWYLAQAMPYDRGSAAITDALTKAIFLSHDISVGQWKLHITPDIVAFMVTPEKFVSIYPELFE